MKLITVVLHSVAALLIALGGTTDAAKMINEVDFLPYYPFFPYGKNFDYVLTDPPNYVFAEGDEDYGVFDHYLQKDLPMFHNPHTRWLFVSIDFLLFFIFIFDLSYSKTWIIGNHFPLLYLTLDNSNWRRTMSHEFVELPCLNDWSSNHRYRVCGVTLSEWLVKQPQISFEITWVRVIKSQLYLKLNSSLKKSLSLLTDKVF